MVSDSPSYEDVWTVTKFSKEDESLVQAWTLHGVATNEIERAFAGSPDEFPGGEHEIGEAQRAFFQDATGERLDLETFIYFVGLIRHPLTDTNRQLKTEDYT